VPVFVCRSGNPLAAFIGLQGANFNLSRGFCLIQDSWPPRCSTFTLAGDDRQSAGKVELTFGIFRL
jgi:hypothetical protein